MKVTAAKNEQIANMTFASIYPHYVSKIEKKGRAIDHLNQIIEWLTGYSETQINKMIEENVTFKTFFEKASLHPNATKIKGVICGYRIEEIPDEFPTYRQCRYLDKLVDELAKGKALEKIMRS